MGGCLTDKHFRPTAYNARVGDFEALYQRAAAWARQGRYRQAESAYRQAIDLRPDDVKTPLGLALVLRRQRQSVDAEAVLRGAIAPRPDLASAHAQPGAVLFQQSRSRDAPGPLPEAPRLLP